MGLPTYIFIIIIATLFVFTAGELDAQLHRTKRQQLLLDEQLLSLGGKTQLTPKEEEVNNCLMAHKFQELNYCIDNPRYFNFSYHFFKYKDNIRKSKVYQIIKDMPKGAVLHLHDMGILSPDYLLNITYHDNLYVCFEENAVKLKFYDKKRSARILPPCEASWISMQEARATTTDLSKFNSYLRQHFTLLVDNPDIVYPSIEDSWQTFMKYFSTVLPLLTYRPIWESYFYDALKRLREDNIMYVEVRSILPHLYDLNGATYDERVTAISYKKTIKRFMKDYPDFVGAKIIYAPSRNVDIPQLEKYLEIARQVKNSMPDVFAGFDLVGEEDLGSPLIEFLPQLTKAGKEFNYFFHAGETNWYGTLTDENLVDAILLGAKRIGHGYALAKHPLLVQEVLKRDIGIEVAVISNSVLSLVHDVRNHPLSMFLAQGLPVVLSSDDPGAWEADPLSDDFYVAFIGVTSRLSDLRLLKTLALNSLKYSAMDAKEKVVALDKFNVRWNEFIDKFNCSLYQ